ncbi:MAG: hypothetical protein QGH33_00810, partial [Pirellulaceae bacterium]|nr:hypothetical protein [Pirellulaceae bacterium]
DQLELIETRRSDQRNHALWEVFANDRLMSLVREAVEFKHQPRCDHLTPFAETTETVARAYYDFVVKFIVRHYGCDDSPAVTELAVCMDRHQPRQLDLLSAGWWACCLRARSNRLKARWPRVAPHPQIGVYAASLLWMAQYVSTRPHDWRRWLPVSGRDDDGLDLLIRAWRICGYGCRIC